jgi:peptidoglycan/xylan/chitin deacetylase (PgdA/CDA1 family)
MSGARPAQPVAPAGSLPHLPAHDRYDYHPLPLRAGYDWPGDRRLAVMLVSHAEWCAFGAGLGDDPARPGEPQTRRNYAWRDYGNRVGAWNLLALLDELRLPAAHCMDTLVYREAPALAEAIRARGDEVVAHGRTAAETLRGQWPGDEARLLRAVTEAIAAHEGAPPAGWMGAAMRESAATPDLLRELGYRYLLDWPMDDQPVWLRTRAGTLLALPVPLEMDDALHVVQRRGDAAAFCDMLNDQFGEMVEESARRPLVMGVSLHPHVTGHPFRIRLLRRALAHCLGHPLAARAWWCRPREVAAHCAALPPRIVPGS